MTNKIFSGTLKTKKTSYLPEVDGLRAIAVLLVLIFHLNPTGFFSGGFIGVDIFFVISGFLITGIIYEKTLKNEFSYFKFLELRISRLYPALLFVITFTLIIAFIIYSPDYYKNAATAAEYSLFSLGNLFFAKEKGYWDLDSISNPFLHTWSLGVEQQFYLVWPILIILSFKLNKKNNLMTILVIVSLLSLYLAEKLSYTNPTHSFYYMPTRIFELGSGGIWYIYNKNHDFLKNKIENWHKELIFLAGISSIFIISIFYHGDIKSHPGIYTIPIVISTIFCIYGGSAKYSGVITRNRATVFIGLISYSIYLIHWPIIVFYKYITFSNEITLKSQFFILLLTFILACALYWFVENKYRRFSFSLKSKPIYVFSLVFFAIFIASHYTIKYKEKITTSIDSYSSWVKSDFCKRVEDAKDVPWACTSGAISSKNKYLVIGDSHAAQLIPFYNYIGKNNDIEFTIIASPHCIPIKGFDIKKSSQSDFCQISIDYAKLQLTKFDIIIMNGVWGDSHTNNDFFKKNLQIFLDDTKDNNQKVVFVSAIPKLQSDPKILVGSYFLKHFADIKTINIPIEANKTFSKIISDNSNAKFVDLYNSEAFKNIPFYNGELMYFDPSHLTVHGSLIYAKFSEKKILNALKE